MSTSIQCCCSWVGVGRVGGGGSLSLTRKRPTLRGTPSNTERAAETWASPLGPEPSSKPSLQTCKQEKATEMCVHEQPQHDVCVCVWRAGVKPGVLELHSWHLHHGPHTGAACAALISSEWNVIISQSTEKPLIFRQRKLLPHHLLSWEGNRVKLFHSSDHYSLIFYF